MQHNPGFLGAVWWGVHARTLAAAAVRHGTRCWCRLDVHGYWGAKEVVAKKGGRGSGRVQTHLSTPSEAHPPRPLFAHTYSPPPPPLHTLPCTHAGRAAGHSAGSAGGGCLTRCAARHGWVWALAPPQARGGSQVGFRDVQHKVRQGDDLHNGSRHEGVAATTADTERGRGREGERERGREGERERGGGRCVRDACQTSNHCGVGHEAA
jgi:hypothetical protein